MYLVVVVLVRNPLSVLSQLFRFVVFLLVFWSLKPALRAFSGGGGAREDLRGG